MFKDELESMSPDARRRVYEGLWHKLTVAGRAVCSDVNLDLGDRFEGMKQLNEIQHRVWGAHQNPADYAPSDLQAVIDCHMREAPCIRGHVEWALNEVIKRS